MANGSRTKQLRKEIDGDPVRRARVDAIKRQMHQLLKLNELRRRFDMTQQQVAASMGVTQESVSQIERRNEILLSTLLKYVDALGGTLEVTAVVGDQRVHLLTALRDRDARAGGHEGIDA
jgi:DNA-binding XRE family transcriptional regulator